MTSDHFRDGHPVMVDVSAKPESVRTAVAEAFVRLPAEAAARLDAANPKGDALAVAELAGVMAAKRTADLIPLCHPLPLDAVQVACERTDGGVRVRASCKTSARTGVEMEALTAASVAALTLYDMLKGASKAIELERVRLLEKTGGKGGPWKRG